MERKNIFELMSEKFNIKKEMQKISDLFLNQKMIIYSDNFNFKRQNFTIEDFVNSSLLFSWKQRGLYFNCDEIKNDLNLKFDDFSEDEIIKVLEYYSNLIFLVKKFSYQNPHIVPPCQLFNVLIDNIEIILEQLNYQKLIFAKEEKVILVPKSAEAIAVAEISSENTALAILKYNHASLKGNLNEKRKILYEIAMEYEILLKHPVEGFKDYFAQAKHMLNSLNIRHNNTKSENNKNQIIDMPENDLEHWYDELYQLLLFCVLIKDNVKRKQEITDMLKTLNEDK